MDRGNHRQLTAMCPPTRRGKLHLLMDFAPESEARELPDPYFGGGDGFELVLDLAEAAGRGLVARICEQHLAPR
jgi:protein-tyrosine phosphatase